MMIKTKNILLSLLIIFSLESLAFAEPEPVTNTAPIAQQTGSNAINKGSINTINSQLTQLQSDINQLSFKDENQSIESPVNNSNIIHKIEELNSREITQSELSESVTTSDNAKEYLDHLKTKTKVLATASEQVKKVESRIKEIQQLLSNPLNQLGLSPDDIESLPSLLQQTQDLSNKINNKQTELQQLITSTENKVNLLENWKNAVNKAYTIQASKSFVATQETEKDRLTELRNKYLEQSKNVQYKLENSRSYLKIDQIRTLHDELYYNETMAWLTDIDIELLNSFYAQDIRIAQNPDSLKNTIPEDLQKILDSVQLNINTLTQKKKEIITKRQELEKKTDQTTDQQFDLINPLTTHEKNITEQLNSLQNTPALIKRIIDEKRQQALYTRDTLYQNNNFSKALKDIPKSLVLLGFQIKISFSALFQFMTEQYWRIGVLVASILITSFIVIFITRHFVRRQRKKAKSTNFELLLFQNLKEIIRIFRYSYIPIILLISLIASVKLSEISPPSDKIILLLSYLLIILIIWFGATSVALKGNKITPKIAYQSRISVTIFFFFIALFFLSRYSSASYFVTSTFEKILFISTIYFIWTTRLIIFSFTYNKDNKSVINRSIKVTINLMTWVSISFTLIGLLGYNKLAWVLIKYASAIVLYLIILTYGNNIIRDFRKFSKLYCIKKFNHGAFIAQDIASPFSTILMFIWLFIVTKLFFVMFQWDSNTYLISRILEISNYTITTFGDTVITPLRVILLIILLSMISRIGRWFKSVSYRWVFSRINDLGIRTSLSIFTQYFIICIGLLITLNIIGINLTSLAVFAGAIGVGVGLGLQDIAKNFISGILLLIERPLRTGDTVDINNIEGSIKRIGMRAITLETFDRKEVIIPNSDVISKEFTNWTHTNTILRTVLYIGAGYETEPELVISTVKEIINHHSAILTDPEPDVIMWEFADSSINYRVHFYTDLDTSSLLEVRNHVLTNIWHQFKKHGISCPYPQRDIHIKTNVTGKIPS